MVYNKRKNLYDNIEKYAKIWGVISMDKENQQLGKDEVFENTMFEKEYVEFIRGVSSKIIYYRQAANMTREKLAEASDLNISYINQIESGKFDYNVSLKTLLQIAKALDISVCKLLDV